MTRVFISYRRDDAADAAGRIYDRLQGLLGFEAVFHDVSSIEFGEDYWQETLRWLPAADVVLVVIGERWSNATDRHGRRRLDNPADIVRRELELAIESEVPIVPVLVGRARMPEREELPDSLASLSTINAAPLRDTDYAYDFNRLLEVIKKHEPVQGSLGRNEGILDSSEGLNELSLEEHSAASTPVSLDRRKYAGWAALVLALIGGAYLFGFLLPRWQFASSRVEEKAATEANAPSQAPLPAVPVGVQRHPGDFVVEGTTSLANVSLIADRIVFRPGSTLVFSREALSKSRSFLLVTREILSEDPARPGTITWERPPRSVSEPGQAPSGEDGREDGQDGETGRPGADGATGHPGEDAPSLILLVEKMKDSKLVVDFAGGPGGPGGRGQKGGEGGNGTRGSHASDTLFECKRGAGDGGNGGPGGLGGTGGRGGIGGRGGSVTLLATADALEPIKDQLDIRVDGGAGGLAGPGGEGGQGGRGGPRGAPALPLCKDDGKDGSQGRQGEGGKIGEGGEPGSRGEVVWRVLTEAQLSSYFEPLGG